MPDIFIFDEDETRSLARTAKKIHEAAKSEVIKAYQEEKDSIYDAYVDASHEIASAVVQGFVAMYYWKQTMESET